MSMWYACLLFCVVFLAVTKLTDLRIPLGPGSWHAVAHAAVCTLHLPEPSKTLLGNAECYRSKIGKLRGAVAFRGWGSTETTSGASFTVV